MALRQLSSTTFVANALTDSRDRLSVEIGDAKQVEFWPQIKALRWDNEVNVSLRLATPIDGTRVDILTDRVRWQRTGLVADFYELPDSPDVPGGGFEFEITLTSKPMTNQMAFTLQSKGVEFLYQPPLDLVDRLTGDTAHEYAPGRFYRRLANVSGSWAVYHAATPPNIVGGLLYRSGKVGHIFRPRVVDANGVAVWADVSIDVVAGLLTVTIPQAFLDSAVYPVR